MPVDNTLTGYAKAWLVIETANSNSSASGAAMEVGRSNNDIDMFYFNTS